MLKFILAGVLMLAIGPSTGAPVSPADRFTVERTEKGFIRLDRATGAISECTNQSTGLVCRLAADERAAYEQKLTALGTELTRLREQLKAIEAKPGSTAEKTNERAGLIEFILARMIHIARRNAEDTKPKDRPQG